MIFFVRKNLGYRAWFFFRTGWSLYFALIFSAVNTLIVTYYLAIENIPALKEIFPSFMIYFLVLVSIGIPILVTVGYIHYKKTHAHASEIDITTETNPYFYKLPPGFWKEVIMPLYLLISEMMVKTSKETLTDEQQKTMSEIQQKMNKLIEGGYVGHPTWESTDDENNSKA